MATQTYGLLPLATPRDAVVEIIFVHGLTGDRIGTWTHSTTNFWPRHCLPSRFQQARIFTHGYNADVYSKGTGVIEDFTHDLIYDVLGRRADDQTSHLPLIFIAHSLGGLVVKQALMTCLDDDAPDEFQSIVDCCLGIMFMGTPHKGAQVAIWGDRLVRPARFFASFNERILEELRSDAKGLVKLQISFESFLNRKDVELRVFCFVEENTYFRGHKIVDDDSAILPSRPHHRKFIHAHHVDMTKFANMDDVGYSDVCTVLHAWMPPPPTSPPPPRDPPRGDGPDPTNDRTVAALSQIIIKLFARQMGMPEAELNTSETRSALRDAVKSMFPSGSRPAGQSTPDTAESQVLYRDDEHNFVVLRGDQIWMRYNGRAFQPTSLRELLPLCCKRFATGSGNGTGTQHCAKSKSKSTSISQGDSS